MSKEFYRFVPSIGWLIHLWKCVTRQDHAAWRGVLEPLIAKDAVVIDVGAHGGQFTRLLAGLVPNGLVVAVEPSSYARTVLRSALWLRGVRNVTVFASALGASPGVALLSTPIKRYGDMGYGLAYIRGAAAPAGTDARVALEPVVVSTLDDLVEGGGFARVDFIKADIEGYEAALIAGAGATLKRFRPVLLLEHDATFLERAGAALETLWASLLDLGYIPHAVAEDSMTLEQISGGPRQGDIVWRHTGNLH